MDENKLNIMDAQILKGLTGDIHHFWVFQIVDKVAENLKCKLVILRVYLRTGGKYPDYCLFDCLVRSIHLN